MIIGTILGIGKLFYNRDPNFLTMKSDKKNLLMQSSETTKSRITMTGDLKMTSEKDGDDD